MGTVLFILYALALTVMMMAAFGVLNLILAKKDGKRFIGFSAAFADGVAKKALAGLFSSLFVISCFVVLALSAAHIISI